MLLFIYLAAGFFNQHSTPERSLQYVRLALLECHCDVMFSGNEVETELVFAICGIVCSHCDTHCQGHCV